MASSLSTTPYSAFFSSGLLAPPLHIAPSPLNSPILADDIEQLSGVSFPTKQAAPPTPRTPRLRRRRSSITAGMSSLSAIKSPTKSAGTAFLFERIQSDIVVGRDRSGSLGQIDTNVDQLNRSRRHRRTRTIYAPSSAPPEAPLPPLPCSVATPRQRPKLQLELLSPSQVLVRGRGPMTAPAGAFGGMETFQEGDSYEEIEMGAPTSPILGDD